MQEVHSAAMRRLQEEHSTSLSKIGDLATELERYGVDLLSNANLFKGTLSLSFHKGKKTLSLLFH